MILQSPQYDALFKQAFGPDYVSKRYMEMERQQQQMEKKLHEMEETRTSMAKSLRDKEKDLKDMEKDIEDLESDNYDMGKNLRKYKKKYKAMASGKVSFFWDQSQYDNHSHL